MRMAIVMYSVEEPGVPADDVDSGADIVLCAMHARKFRPAKAAEKMNVRGYELCCDLCVEEEEERPVL